MIRFDERVLNGMSVFAAIVAAGSFAAAGELLDMSQPGVSRAVSRLEARLGIRLLNRTTRTVSPTPAGERLLQTVSPRIKEIGAALAATSELRQKPAGLIRLTATENAAEAVLWPAIRKLLGDLADDVVAEPAACRHTSILNAIHPSPCGGAPQASPSDQQCAGSSVRSGSSGRSHIFFSRYDPSAPGERSPEMSSSRMSDRLQSV